MAPTAQQSLTPTLNILHNGMAAELCFQADCPTSDASAEALMQLAKAKHLLIDRKLETRLHQIAVDFQRKPHPVRTVIAEGTPAHHGVNGRLEWLPEFDPEKRARPNLDDEDITPANYYELSAFHIVAPDTHIATVHPPTSGRPGVDVYGQPTQARDGEPYELAADGSVSIEADGRVITRIAGLIVFENDTLHIDPTLNVPANVDFTTGNIHFNGDVFIKGDVCDQFTIDATGDVEVHGLVEGAHIRCDGALRALGGVAGKEHAFIDVGGSVEARYLSGVNGIIKGDLTVARDMVTSEMKVHGELHAEAAVITGADLTVAGPARIGVLGAPAGIATTLRVGFVPRLTDLINQIGPTIEKMEFLIDDLRRKLQHLSDQYHMHREKKFLQRQVSLNETITRLETKLDRARNTLDDLCLRFDRQCVIRLEAVKAIHGGVVVEGPRWRIEFFDTVTGGTVIRRGEDGSPIVEDASGNPRDLSRFAHVVPTQVW